MKQNKKKHKQTLESEQYRLEITFKEHCCNISVDILDRVLYWYSGTTYDIPSADWTEIFWP